ncbi:hypothetical protein ACRRTK_021021 [Alexandromys fortis]
MKTLSLCFENQDFSGLAVLLAALRTLSCRDPPLHPSFPNPTGKEVHRKTDPSSSRCQV